MSTFLLIASREYFYNFKRPRYLISAFGVPVFFFGVYFIVFSLIAQDSSETFSTIGYVDNSEILQDIDVPDDFESISDEGIARKRLFDGEIDAYIIINASYLANGQVDFYSTKAASTDISGRIASLMEEGLISRAITAYPPERLKDPVNLNLYTFDGELLGRSEEELLPRFAVPFAFIMVMYIATNTTASFLLSSIVEEKENRMMELLITSCTPEQLMWGKLVGLGTLAMTQIAAWASGAILISGVGNQAGEFISNSGVTVNQALLFIGLFILQYTFLASLMLGLGASVSAETEAQQIAGLLSLSSLIPIMGLGFFINNTDSPILYALNIFPVTAPVTLLTRMALLGGVSDAWIYATIIILIASVFMSVWLSAKIFRLGMLNYGKRLRVRDILRMLFNT